MSHITLAERGTARSSTACGATPDWVVVRRYLTLDDSNPAQEVPLLEPKPIKTTTKKAA